jgi:hypothetical protein
MTRDSSDGSRSGDHHRIEATKRKIFGWNDWVDKVVGGLKPIPALVWAVLYRHATAGIVTRSNSLLAKDVGVSRETIKRAIATLRKEKLLQVVRQGGMRVGPTTYRLAVRDLRRSAAGGSAGEAEANCREEEGTAETAPEAPVSPVVDASMVPNAELPTEPSTTAATGLPGHTQQVIGGQG